MAFPHAWPGVVQELDATLLKHSDNPAQRIRARGDRAVELFHSRDRPQGHFRFLRQLRLRPAQETPRGS